MNPPSPELRDRIRLSVERKETGELRKIIDETIRQTGRRVRKDRIREINTAILESALETDDPSLLSLLQDVSFEDLNPISSALLSQYIRTKNNAWFDAIMEIINSLGKKGDQSETLANLCRMLVEAGSVQSDRLLINRGMDLFSRITFRKYKSEILSKIAPLLIGWAEKDGDVAFLSAVDSLSDEITDVSKKSVIQARLAIAIAAIGTSRDDLEIWAGGIRTAANIRQKTRRQACFANIVEAAASTPLFDKIRNIPIITDALSGLAPEVLNDFIAAVVEQVLTRQNERAEIIGLLRMLTDTLPGIQPTLIEVLLKHTENTGDPWFITQAMNLNESLRGAVCYPAREYVRAALSVVRTTGSTEIIRRVVPAVSAACSPEVASRILLQIVEVLLNQGELADALSVFVQVDNEGEKSPLYDECLTAIWKHAIVTDKVVQVQDAFTGDRQRKIWSGAIYNAVADICRQHAFSEIAVHSDSLAAAMALHPQRDQLVLDSITMLIHRGFLETANPDVLIHLSRSIGDPAIRERALSTIVIRVSKLGAETKNRDFLQRAVGLSCLIEDVKTRSLTLTAIIDEATTLAVNDGDFDLLRRMREWSSSLLSRDGEISATAKIIEGMITYASDRRHPAALDEACQIASGIADPSLKKEMTERISESYVRIGCLFMQDLHTPPDHDEFFSAFRLFERGLSILTDHERQEDPSLKIAHIIDIIIDNSRDHFRIDIVLPLTLFALEIRQPFERDAMVTRIAPMIRTLGDQTDTPDPYESIAAVLLLISHVPQDPALLDIVRRTVEHIKDPFTRSLQLVRLGGLYLMAGRQDQARALFDGVCSSLSQVIGEYRRVILLADCAVHYATIAEELAYKSIREALDILETMEYDPDATACRHLVGAIARLYEVRKDPDLLTIAQDIASRINEPVDFVAVMLPVYHMAAGSPDTRNAILKQILVAGEAITIAAQRAALLLTLARSMVKDQDYPNVLEVLSRIVTAARLVRIPFLADTIRIRIAEMYIQIGKTRGEDSAFSLASGIVGEIEHEDIRMSAPSLSEKINPGVAPHYHKMLELTERLVTERYSPAQVSGLENLIRTAPDRGVIARYFCSCAIMFNSTGKTRLARQFYTAALNEAAVIRPLSRRAYVMCDCALMLDKAGCEANAQKFLGMAVDAATGIRQFADRDEVFDNLAAAVRWMQQEEPV